MINLTSPQPWRRSIYIVTALASLIALIGIAWLPIEAHEAFVLLAAQHMLDTGNWVIPYFNGEPHLTKPPLNYWLTMLVSWLSNGGHVEAWHGRLPSALAGIGMVVTTAYAGRKLFDEGIGLLAAIILASCSGYFYYTHSARPEVLYALCCNLAILAYLYIRDDTASPRQKMMCAYGIWFAFALATLTKGPHIPGILLIAFVIDKRWQGSNLKQAVLVLRPVSGLLLTAAIALPWWWMLNHRLGAGGLHGTQLSGSLITVNPVKLLSSYYLFRPLQLLLPWILFLPTLVLIFRNKSYHGHIKLLVLLIVLPALVLSFGPQKRWYYMMPALLPMSILLAAAIMTYLRGRPVHSLMLKVVPAFAVLTTLLFVSAACSKWPWGVERFSQAELAQQINKSFAGHSRVVTWDVTPEIYAFYSGKVIGRVENVADIRTLLSQEKSEGLLLLMQTKNLPQLPADIPVQPLGHTSGGDGDNVPTTLVSIGPSAQP